MYGCVEVLSIKIINNKENWLTSQATVAAYILKKKKTTQNDNWKKKSLLVVIVLSVHKQTKNNETDYQKK